jgi:hypothetical protein
MGCLYARQISNKISANFTVTGNVFYVGDAGAFNTAYTNAKDGDTIIINDGATLSFQEQVIIKKQITIKALTLDETAIEFTGSNPNAQAGVKPNFSPNCGTKTGAANFCPNCGQKLI